MNKVKILKSINGVNDGEIYPSHFVENTIAHIGDDLLAAFINMGVVELVEGDSFAQPAELEITSEKPLETKPAKAVRETKPARKGK